MPSDLATALISGQNNATMMDPAMAGIMPQLQLAQALSTQGMSTAPASPWQAAGRLAQALAGVKVGNDAQNDLSALNSNATSEMGKIFPEGTPIGDGLRSASPMVRMLSMQQAGKAMLLNSESKTLGPEQSQVIPGTPRAGGGVVATGQPALAGATEAAKTPALVARAGATAKVEAPYRPGGEITVPGGPSGMQTIPATAATRAAIQPGAAPPSASPAPAANPLAPKPVATVPATPNFSERFAGVGGTPVKTPAYEGQIEAEKGNAEDFIKKSVPSYEAAQNLMGRLTVMDHNIDALGPKWMGAGANAKGEFGKTWNSMLDSAGVKGYHIDPNKVATWEEFNKESTRAGMELIKANFGGSREAASIIQMGASAVPSAQQSYLGAKYNAASIRAATQREIDLHEYKADLLAKGKSLTGADAAFNKERPAQDYAMGGIVSVIPKPAVAHLRANPTLAPQFNKQFGDGTAEYALGH